MKSLPPTYHGSNSWIMLSKRMTANNREEKPEIQATSRMANVIKLLQPAVFRLNNVTADLPPDFAPVLIIISIFLVAVVESFFMGVIAKQMSATQRCRAANQNRRRVVVVVNEKIPGPQTNQMKMTRRRQIKFGLRNKNTGPRQAFTFAFSLVFRQYFRNIKQMLRVFRLVHSSLVGGVLFSAFALCSKIIL